MRTESIPIEAVDSEAVAPGGGTNPNELARGVEGTGT